MYTSTLSKPRALAIGLIRRMRPAPFGSMLLTCLGLNRRRRLDYGECVFYGDPSSDLGFRLLRGSYESGTEAVLKKYLRPGSTFLDLGANEGFFSVLASRLVGPAGEVVSVEPQSRLLPVLQKNLGLNFCYNCRIAQCALSDKNGSVVIYLLPKTNTGASACERPTRYPVPVEVVCSWTLAEFLTRAGVQVVDLAKVDIEGAEYQVFMPAGEVLRRGILRNIVLEYHGNALRRQGLSPERLHEHFLACGYRLEDSLGARVYEFRP